MRGSSRKTQEEGIIGGDASLYEGVYSPRGLSGSRWFDMVKAFREESSVQELERRGRLQEQQHAGNLLKMC